MLCVPSCSLSVPVAGYGNDSLAYAQRFGVTTDARYGEYKGQKFTCDKSRIQNVPDSDVGRTSGEAVAFIQRGSAVELMRVSGRCSNFENQPQPAVRRWTPQQSGLCSHSALNICNCFALPECCPGCAMHCGVLSCLVLQLSATSERSVDHKYQHSFMACTKRKQQQQRVAGRVRIGPHRRPHNTTTKSQSAGCCL